MAGETNYALIWFIYLASSAAFYLVFWKFSSLAGGLPAWLLRTLLAVLILTPVLPQSENEVAVPALMAVALDSIASGPGSAARALAALSMGMILGCMASFGLFLLLRLRRRKSRWKIL